MSEFFETYFETTTMNSNDGASNEPKKWSPLKNLTEPNEVLKRTQGNTAQKIVPI